MSKFENAWQEHQRKRWMRPDAYRWVRPDAYRFMPPDAPRYDGKDAVKYFWPEAETGDFSPHDDTEAAELQRELDAIRRDFEALKREWHARKYSPDQPRVPAGNPRGGQFMRVVQVGGADGNDSQILSDATPDDFFEPGAQLAQNDRSEGFLIDLDEERELGGHTIEGHVGKSEKFLLSRVRREALESERTGFSDGLRVGSFSSMESATKLVNSTLAQNPTMVGRVASGISPRETVSAEFGSVTGYEAYARTERSQPYMRKTTGVSVVIVRDGRAAKGYRVDTAFPRNFDR